MIITDFLMLITKQTLADLETAELQAVKRNVFYLLSTSISANHQRECQATFLNQQTLSLMSNFEIVKFLCLPLVA